MEAVPRTTVLEEVSAPGVAGGVQLAGIAGFTGVVHADVRMAVQVAGVETGNGRRAAFDGRGVVAFGRAAGFADSDGVGGAVGASRHRFPCVLMEKTASFAFLGVIADVVRVRVRSVELARSVAEGVDDVDARVVGVGRRNSGQRFRRTKDGGDAIFHLVEALLNKFLKNAQIYATSFV